MYSIVEFHPAEPAGPVSLGDLLLAARDSVIHAFHSCLEQIRVLRAALAAERQGNRIHAAALCHEANRKAADTIEVFLGAAIQLGRLQSAVTHWADARLDELDVVDPGLFRSVCDVVDWRAEMPAAKLMAPCQAIIDAMNAGSAIPESSVFEKVNTSILDGMDMRINARTHGMNLPFMEHAAALMHLPELVNAG